MTLHNRPLAQRQELFAFFWRCQRQLQQGYIRVL